MFGRRLRAEDSNPREGDACLTALLREWKAVEPRGSFEVDVWRRIRTASVPAHGRANVVTILPKWFAARPVWVGSIAAAAGIVVGAGVALSASAMHDVHEADEPLTHSHTIAGAYLALVAGGIR